MRKDHPQISAEALSAAIHVVGGGRTVAGFEAMRFLLLRLPLACWLGALLHLPGAAAPGRRAYRWVADHRHGALECRIGETTILHKTFANVLIVAALGLALAGPLAGIEDWPLTCLPMFATPVEDDGARYSFRFVAEDDRGASREMPSDACGVPELRLKRIFFGRFYGSVDEDYEHGAFPGDTPEAFEARMTDFFARFVESAAERGRLPDRTARVRLLAVRSAGDLLERHVVGTYDIRDRRFRRSP